MTEQPQERPKADVLLERFGYTPDGTFGKLILPMDENFDPDPLLPNASNVGAGGFECFTVEKPWVHNMPRISCIPCGEYKCMLSLFHRRNYPAWHVLEVPGRSLIKIHRANTMDEVRGCIALGIGTGYVDGRWAVTRSKDAYEEWMEVTTKRFPDGFTLAVRNIPINIGCLPNAINVATVNRDGLLGVSVIDLSKDVAVAATDPEPEPDPPEEPAPQPWPENVPEE